MNRFFDEKIIFFMLKEMEEKYSNEILNFGFESWPITKMFLFRNFSTKSMTEKSKEKKLSFLSKSRKKIFKNLRQLFYQYIFKRQKINTNISSDIKNIFFSRSVYLDKIPSGKYFDRITDPIYLTSLANVGSLKFYLDSNFLDLKLYTKGYIYRQNHIGKFTNLFNKEYHDLKKKCMFFLRSFISLHKLEYLEDSLYYDLKITIEAYIRQKNKATKFLRKFESLRKIFLTAWYFSDGMGIIAAANALNIETIDLQHGKQGKYQLAYSGWKYIPQKGFVNLPSIFWCWGEKSKNDILLGSINRKNHLPILGGFSWPIWYDTFISKKETNNCNVRVKLLFTMQRAKIYNSKEPIENGLVRIVEEYDALYKKGLKDELHIRIRIHPNQIEESLSYLKDRFGKLFYSKIMSFSSKSVCSLYDDFNWSTHHLTNFSSSAIESIAFNIKSAVYGKLAYEIYKDEILNKSLYFLKNCNHKEISNWIKNNNSSPPKISTKYILSKFPNPKIIC